MMTEFPRATRRLPFSGLRDDREAEEIECLSSAPAVAGREPAQNSNTPEPTGSSTIATSARDRRIFSSSGASYEGNGSARSQSVI